MSDKQPVAEEKNEDEGPMYKAFGRCCNCGTDLKIKGPFFLVKKLCETCYQNLYCQTEEATEKMKQKLSK